MLLSELDGGFSYLAFSVRRGNRLSVLLLFLLYLAYLLMASLLGKKRQRLLFHFIKWGDFTVDYIMQLEFFLIAGAILLFFASLIIRLFFLLLCDLTGFIIVMLKGFIKVSNFFIRK